MPALVGCCPPAGKGRGKGGFCTFFGARPRGQRGEEQQQQREPQGPAPLHGAGRDPGPRPRRLGQVARHWASQAGQAGVGAGPARGRGLDLTWFTFLKGQ